MLVELAIADAYGGGFEYVPKRMVREQNHLRGYATHPRFERAPGRYTDDTQMALGIAELMADGGDWTPDALAARFHGVFARDPREGYARRFHAFLTEIGGPEEFLARIVPTSEKSGAAMRAGPIGLYADEGEVMARADLQARITHDTPGGRAAAQAAALSTHFFARLDGDPADLPAYLSDRLSDPIWEVPWTGRVGALGMMSARAAVTLIAAHDSLADLLSACVDLLGDVDTVATIAVGAAACSTRYAQDLPEALYDGLEDGAYGRAYLEALDARLMEAVALAT
jgi:ADP-ribosylglycohydrolase